MKNQESKHTPTPWLEAEQPEGHANVYYKKDGKSVLIATVEKPEDAAFIVKACNNYDEMLEFLQTEEKFLRSLYEQGTLSEPHHIKWNNLKALIAKATPPVS